MKNKFSQTFGVRHLNKGEISTITLVYIEAFNKADVGEKWNQKSAEKFMNWWFKYQPDLFFVATFEKRLVGGIVASIKPWWDGNHLVDGELFVHPNYQKKGIGKKLFKMLLKEALKKYNIVNFEGLADKTYKFPLSWYKKLGMKKTNLLHISGDPKKILGNID